MILALLVLGRSSRDLFEFLAQLPERAKEEAVLQLSANPNKVLGGYACVANAFLDSVSPHTDVCGVVHADTRFDAGALSIFAASALEGEGRIVGLVGRSGSGEYVWAKCGGGQVSTLDCCSVFFPSKTGLRFDGETFDDFHCVVEDLCLQGREIGLHSFVPAAQADHLGTVADPNSEWQRSYRRYRYALSRKWQHVNFQTT